MPKTKPDTINWWGKQTPDDEIQWLTEITAGKVGWTTAEGRAKVQLDYDNALAEYGVTAGDSTRLRWVTRTEYRAYTPNVYIVDGTQESVTGEPDQAQALDQIQSWLDASVDPPTTAVQIQPADVPPVLTPSTAEQQALAAEQSQAQATEGTPETTPAPTPAPAAPATPLVVNILNPVGPVPPAQNVPVPPAAQA